jgi:hypothetical protein
MHALGLRGSLAANPMARTFHALVLALTIWWAFWTIILIPVHHRLALALFGDAVPVVALVLLRVGYFRGATFVYLAGIWLYSTIGASLNGGIRSLALLNLVTLPVLATWLLGQRAALWTAAVCLADALAFAFLELTGLMVLPFHRFLSQKCN